MWKSRASRADVAIQTAYGLQLPLRVIICDGKKRDADALNVKASSVNKRLLDPVSWAVISYNKDTGDCVLERGAVPVKPANDADAEDEVLEGFEGETKQRFVLHRKREARFRNLKIQEALHKNNGRLICEVPNCGFDFADSYGNLGMGYAQIHHKSPLSEAPITGRKIVLDDLAVVCANCHVMIHRGGECRPLESLILKQQKSRMG
jgi:5-methylcytosine-specific restriction enzyme A